MWPFDQIVDFVKDKAAAAVDWVSKKFIPAVNKVVKKVLGAAATVVRRITCTFRRLARMNLFKKIAMFFKVSCSLAGSPVALIAAVGVGMLLLPASFALIGFGTLGPIQGSFAASFQSRYGTPLGFRVLQSAAMGGWGGLVVNAASAIVLLLCSFII